MTQLQQIMTKYSVKEKSGSLNNYSTALAVLLLNNTVQRKILSMNG